MYETTEVWDTYWQFAYNRLMVYYDRLYGTNLAVNDPIIKQYRFTNTFRASDRVSQYLIRNVQYDSDWSPNDLFFRTMLFKIFNRIDTWEYLVERFGQIRYDPYTLMSMEDALDERAAQNYSLYTGSYMMARPPFGGSSKHGNHIRLLKHMMDTGVPERIQDTSLGTTYGILLEQRGIGPFLAFQCAIDLNYSTLLDSDEDAFVSMGSGALSGIYKCFVGSPNPESVIRWVNDRQDEEFDRLGLKFPGLFGRKLHLTDCENLFCEVSKYTRISHPNVKGKSRRHKIKRGYTKDTTPIPQPFFPPKWGLNIPEFIQNNFLVDSDA